jgi:hypothetical protein
MRNLRVLAWTLCGLVACSGHRRLDTQVNGRTAETLQAVAERAAGGWTVSMPLPGGRWVGKAEGEEVPFRVVEGPTGSILKWEVTSERWGQERPFKFRLEGEHGTFLNLGVHYGVRSGTSKVLLNVAYMLAGGKPPG